MFENVLQQLANFGRAAARTVAEFVGRPHVLATTVAVLLLMLLAL